MLATNRSYENICCFGQNYQPGKVTLQVTVLIIKYLVAVHLDKVTCAVFLGFEKWYGCVVKGLHLRHLKRKLLILSKKIVFKI